MTQAHEPPEHSHHPGQHACTHGGKCSIALPLFSLSTKQIGKQLCCEKGRAPGAVGGTSGLYAGSIKWNPKNEIIISWEITKVSCILLCTKWPLVPISLLPARIYEILTLLIQDTTSVCCLQSCLATGRDMWTCRSALTGAGCCWQARENLPGSCHPAPHGLITKRQGIKKSWKRICKISATEEWSVNFRTWWT